MAYELILPYPPSVNHYWKRGKKGVHLSQRARMFREDVSIRALDFLRANKTLRGPLEVEIFAHPPDGKLRDLDNLLKATLDSLSHALVIGDDSQIKRLSIEWGRRIKGGRMVCVLHCLEPASAKGSTEPIAEDQIV